MTISNKKTQTMLKYIKDVFENKIPFNKVIGMKIISMSLSEVEIEFKMNKKLIGNFYRQTLHGGVISSVMDVTAGVVAFLGVVQKMHDKPIKEQLERFSRLGTIDLRVDYLRPGTGKFFVTKGTILRAGNRVAVSRCEMFNDENKLIATGTGTYVVA